MIRARLLLAVPLLFLALSARAVTGPDEMLADPELEARARALGKELRCLVCQNQSIDDSDAPLARDLRRIVREQLVAGASEAEIKRFLVERYGEFVLLKPPVSPATWLLWAGPFLMAAAGAALVWTFVRARSVRPEEVTELTAEERQALERLLEGGSGERTR